MKTQEENIVFESMPDFNGLFDNTSLTKKQPVEKKKFSSLFEELKYRCFPERFMDPYDSNKVAISIKLYSDVLDSQNNTEKQSELRRKASEMLGVRFNGDELYNELMEFCDPKLYINVSSI